jgi:hypothetical protein
MVIRGSAIRSKHDPKNPYPAVYSPSGFAGTRAASKERVGLYQRLAEYKCRTRSSMAGWVDMYPMSALP